MKTIIHLSELVQRTDGCMLAIYDKNFGTDKAKLLLEKDLGSESSITFTSKHSTINITLLSMQLIPCYKMVVKQKSLKTQKVTLSPEKGELEVISAFFGDIVILRRKIKGR